MSVFLFMRRARLLTIHRLVFDDEGNLMELRPGDPSLPDRECKSIRLLQLEGQLFFGAAGELANALDDLIEEPEVKVVWLRLRRAFGMDVTITQTLADAATRLRAEGRYLVVVGVREEAAGVLERTETLATLAPENVFAKTDTWFHASDRGLHRALELAGEHACLASCPIRQHLRALDDTPDA
ncbi:MAG: sodium-independent anion transporter [Sandaracinaceae bacterium]|nr:sodium-independent anion transporter [Sandaracinaceae bacterium]